MIMAARDSGASSSKESAASDEKIIRVMSWNIDGLDAKDRRNRALAVAEVIKQEKPDLVLLQEVVPETQAVIEKICRNFKLEASRSRGYYTAFMAKKSLNMENITHGIFLNSTMGRMLYAVKVEVKGIKMRIITTHLESTKASAEERKNQLKACLAEMQFSDPDATVILGGDLNLRDSEVVEIGGLPEGVTDVWEVLGRQKKTEFTWDLQQNDNLKMPGRRQPRLRFDRIYIRHPKNGCPSVKPVSFTFVGKERISTIGRFASDHWGLVTEYKKIDS